MTVAFLAALLAQTDPRIESVERLVGNIRRSDLWAPLAVKVSSASGFDGDLVALSSSGFRFVRKIHVPPNGSESVILPAIDPQKIVAGNTTFVLPKVLKSPDFLVLVDARLAYASELVSDEKVMYQRVEGAHLEKLLGHGLLDACDLLLLKEASGLSLGGVRAWAAAPARADAEKEVAERLKPWVGVALVDDELWSLAPVGDWVPAKKDRTILFAALYALASFGALVFVGRRHAKWAAAAVAGVSALGVGAFLLGFPPGHLWISECACEVVPVEGDAAGIRLWFVGTAADVEPTIRFPRIVKPVFERRGDAEEPLTIRVDERGSSAEGFRLPAGGRRCFASIEGRAPAMRVTGPLPRPLYRASVRIGGDERRVGDLPAGAAVPRSAGGEPAPAHEVEERPWLRFLDGDGVYGWLDRNDRLAEDVGSPDLADGRRRPVFFIQRLK